VQITIIGAGNVGRALASAWRRAGHEVTVGVRAPGDQRHADLAPVATVTDVASAVTGSDVIVLAVPWTAVPEVIQAAGDLSGRLLIDATNPIAGTELELAVGPGTSGGEEVARLAVGASVFKTLNHVAFPVMADTSGYLQAPALFVAGDDEDRKPTVMSLVADLGFKPADAGPLRAARRLETLALIWVDQAVNHGRAWTDAFAYLHKAG
jgi:8-hydroxy-5-deazaflavin:NADPH oxidoreductase